MPILNFAIEKMNIPRNKQKVKDWPFQSYKYGGIGGREEGPFMASVPQAPDGGQIWALSLCDWQLFAAYIDDRNRV